MQFNRNNYYPIDVEREERNIKVKDNSNDWKYALVMFGIIFFVIIIFIIKLFTPDNKEENKQNINETASENIVKTITEIDGGFKEEIVFYTTVKDKQLTIKNSGSRMYLISLENDVFIDYEYIEVGVQVYNDIEIKDNIKVIRTIYYNENKEKLYYDDYIEKIKMF